jgi:hypothetical protein
VGGVRSTLAAALVLAVGFGVASGQDAAPPSVGMLAKLNAVVLPGSKLQAKPLEDSDSIVLRVTAAFPHGTAHRYDLQYYGLEPGTYNLCDYLVRADGSSKSDLPPLKVEVVAVLKTSDARPHPLKAGELPSVGGYSRVLVLFGIAWIAVLVVLLVARRGRAAADESQEPSAQTAANRLRPLVEAAMTGELGDVQKAELEWVLLDYWRERLDLQDLDALTSLKTLREHPEAGELLRRLEEWLHQPPGRKTADVDVTALLKPYTKATPSNGTVVASEAASPSEVGTS